MPYKPLLCEFAKAPTGNARAVGSRWTWLGCKPALKRIAVCRVKHTLSNFTRTEPG